jgi:hypothetical protein
MGAVATAARSRGRKRQHTQLIVLAQTVGYAKK